MSLEGIEEFQKVNHYLFSKIPPLSLLGLCMRVTLDIDLDEELKGSLILAIDLAHI